MSSEEAAFLAQLAATPGDEFLRNVYADWLADHDREPEAERQRVMAPGYRGWVQTGRRTMGGEYNPWIIRADIYSGRFPMIDCSLPEDWFDAIDHPTRSNGYFPWHGHPEWPNVTDQIITDAAALAFAKLPPERQAELLAMAPAQPAESTT